MVKGSSPLWLICVLFNTLLFLYAIFSKEGDFDMQICKKCYVPMINVMSFSKEKREKFARCNKCYTETRHQKISDDEISFGEVLHKKIK